MVLGYGGISDAYIKERNERVQGEGSWRLGYYERNRREKRVEKGGRLKVRKTESIARKKKGKPREDLGGG